MELTKVLPEGEERWIYVRKPEGKDYYISFHLSYDNVIGEEYNALFDYTLYTLSGKEVDGGQIEFNEQEMGFGTTEIEIFVEVEHFILESVFDSCIGIFMMGTPCPDFIGGESDDSCTDRK